MATESAICSRVGTALLALAAIAGCSKSGGGGPIGIDLPPRLLAAALLDDGIARALLLTFSEPVVIAASPSAADFQVGGGTLPTVVGAAHDNSEQAVRLQLARDGDLPPGTATIALADGGRSIRDGAGHAVLAQAPVPVLAGATSEPTLAVLTLNGIEPELNGEGPAGGVLLVPQHGFTIDVGLDRDGVSSPLVVTVHASRPVLVDGALRAVGQDLGDVLPRAAGGGHASLAVPARVEFPDGDVSIIAVAVAPGGRPTPQRTFAFRTTPATDAVRPFESGQSWFLDTSRDLESFTVTALGDGRHQVDIVIGANGVTDLEDVLRIAGLLPDPAAPGAAPMRAALVGRLQTELLDALATLHDGVAIEFTFDPPGPVPQGVLQVPYAEFGFSVICIGGAPGELPTGAMGQAQLDPQNRSQDFNCATDYRAQPQFPPSRLGVFPYSIVEEGLLSPPSSPFRRLFEPFVRELGGTPVGEAADGLDLERVRGQAPGGDPTRTDQIDRAVGALVDVVALVVAHECGHCHGLVADGAMPEGLYGGERSFLGSRSWHIDARSLFPPGAQNVMAPGISFTEPQHPASGFTTLNKAYLRERVLYEVR